MTDQRTPQQQARSVWIQSYSRASAALGRAARTQAAHVAAQNNGTPKPECKSLGLARENASDVLDEMCEDLRRAALALHNFCVPD